MLLILRFNETIFTPPPITQSYVGLLLLLIPLIIWEQWFCKWLMRDRHNPWPGGYPCPSTRYCIVSVRHSKNPILYCFAIKMDFSGDSRAFSFSTSSDCFVPRCWHPAVNIKSCENTLRCLMSNFVFYHATICVLKCEYNTIFILEFKIVSKSQKQIGERRWRDV